MLAIKYKGQECYVHLFSDGFRTDVNLLNQELKDQLMINRFSIDEKGDLLSAGNDQVQICFPALRELYNMILKVQTDLKTTSPVER